MRCTHRPWLGHGGVDPGAGRESFVQRSVLRTAPDFSTAAQFPMERQQCLQYSNGSELPPGVSPSAEHQRRSRFPTRAPSTAEVGGRGYKPQETSRGTPVTASLKRKGKPVHGEETDQTGGINVFRQVWGWTSNKQTENEARKNVLRRPKGSLITEKPKPTPGRPNKRIINSRKEKVLHESDPIYHLAQLQSNPGP